MDHSGSASSWPLKCNNIVRHSQALAPQQIDRVLHAYFNKCPGPSDAYRDVHMDTIYLGIPPGGGLGVSVGLGGRLPVVSCSLAKGW